MNFRLNSWLAASKQYCAEAAFPLHTESFAGKAALKCFNYTVILNFKWRSRATRISFEILISPSAKMAQNSRAHFARRKICWKMFFVVPSPLSLNVAIHFEQLMLIWILFLSTWQSGWRGLSGSDVAEVLIGDFRKSFSELFTELLKLKNFDVTNASFHFLLDWNSFWESLRHKWANFHHSKKYSTNFPRSSMNLNSEVSQAFNWTQSWLYATPNSIKTLLCSHHFHRFETRYEKVQQRFVN